MPPASPAPAVHALSVHEVAIDSLTDRVSVVGEDEVYRMVNDAWCAAAGRTREQVLGRPTREIFPDGDAPHRGDTVLQCLRLNSPQRLLGALLDPAVGIRHVETRYMPLAGLSEAGRCVLIVARDVTEQETRRRTLQASERLLRRTLDATGEGILAVDAVDVDHPVRLVNQQALEIWRLPADVMHTLTLQQFLHHAETLVADGPSVTALWDTMLATRGSGEHRIALIDGRTLRCRCSAADDGDSTEGEVRVWSFRDVTAEERAVQRLSDERRSLEAARDEAQQANQAKSQFLSHMSHELRTPLHAVLGFAQLLQSDSSHLLPERQQRELQEIVRGGRHLLTLINDVLDLGLIEAGRLAFEVRPLLLAPLVAECLRMMQPLADQHGVRLRAPRTETLQRPVLGDVTRVRQVLLNLLTNAIKYNRPGGEVRLACQERRRTLRLVVRDTGPGLNAQQQSRLFTAFERVHDRSTQVEGAGIGLALCRRLMHGMGGEIGVDSVEGAGSRFWIELSRSDLAAEHGGQSQLDLTPPVAPDVVRERRVLYIEDNPVNIVLMQAMLARVPGLHLATQETALGGLEMARVEPPDLILLDIQLPGMGGLELLEHLRADPATCDVPVIAVSANAMDADVAAGRAAGFVDYVTKPVDLPRLISAVQAALETRAAPGPTAGA